MGPTRLAGSGPSITGWHWAERLITHAVGGQMARPCAARPAPPLVPSGRTREAQVRASPF